MEVPSQLTERLLVFFSDPEADHFDALALEIFRYQYGHNRPYRQFCDRLGATPDRIDRWTEIPAVPTAAFAVADLTCLPEQPSTYFLTSGTTRGNDRRGRHIVPNLALARAAIVPNARAHLFSGVERIQILSLTPPPPWQPHSSLIHMIDVMISSWGTTKSGYVGTAQGLDTRALAGALRAAEADRRPVALLGTTAAFILFFDACREEGLAFSLPAQSRLMDTGGNKRADGRRHPLDDRAPLLDACAHTLGIPARHVVNEYGMTELSSQCYAASPAMRFEMPHWVRVRIIDPRTGDDAPVGAPGLLRIYDLANLHSVMAIQTDDIGALADDGLNRFQQLGRAAGAELRGCSLDPSASNVVRR